MIVNTQFYEKSFARVLCFILKLGGVTSSGYDESIGILYAIKR